MHAGSVRRRGEFLRFLNVASKWPFARHVLTGGEGCENDLSMLRDLHTDRDDVDGVVAQEGKGIVVSIRHTESFRRAACGRLIAGRDSRKLQAGQPLNSRNVGVLCPAPLGVGVGTVYRRFPDRAKLMESVLLGILDELSGCAEQALAQTDAWSAFADFFTALALRTREHAGLSESLDERGGPRVATARHRLIDLMRILTDRAQHGGVLRRDLAWRDIPFLAKITAFGTCALDVPGDVIQAQRCIIVVLDGMRVTAATHLPDHATAE